MATSKTNVNGSGYILEYTIPPAYDATVYLIDSSYSSASAEEAATVTLPPELQVATPPAEVTPASALVAGAGTSDAEKKWLGDCMFRLIVLVAKVGSIIGRKGELIKKMCKETRARICILDAPTGTLDHIVLISGKEELEAPLSPAMDVVIRVFQRVSGLSESKGDSKGVASASTFCSIRFLVASTQAINLIGKQGSLIKSIQESTGASVRVLLEGMQFVKLL